MDLGFTKKKMMSIILLLGCIFISLAMSHIPFLISDHNAGINIEGMYEGIDGDIEDEEGDEAGDEAGDEQAVATTPPAVATTPPAVATTTPASATPIPGVTTPPPPVATTTPGGTIKPLPLCSTNALLSSKLLLDNMDYAGARNILNSCS